MVVDDGDVSQLHELRVKEEMLVERAKQLLDKEEALMSLERQLIAKQEALYWRERCLRSEQLTVTTASTATTMPPLIQIQPSIVRVEQPGIVGLERRRVTVMYQPDRQLQLQQMHAGMLMKPVPSAETLTQAKPVQAPTVMHGPRLRIDTVPTQSTKVLSVDSFVTCY